ncbi:MAG: GGDEF domain-containing protein [Lachnospiraceae bacterium]|nr:GGDEF domain-containing protein [Lachnospiraceae bacterium]
MLLTRIDLSIYAILILLFLLIDLHKHPVRNDKAYLFKFILLSNILILIAEIVSWSVDGLPGADGRFLNIVFNSILYSLNLVPLALWCSYFDECILSDFKKRKVRRKIYLSLNLFTVLLVMINLFTNILFRINSVNIFERGIGAPLFATMNYLMFFIYCITLIPYRKLITGRIYQVILSVVVFPAIGGYFQTKYYGLILVWPMTALVCLVGYILIEREDMNRDTVTQLLTRFQLERRMKFMISRHQPFSIIMIDLDKFKSINDNFGHKEGDEALQLISNLLEKSIKQTDQAFRYAGDEFVILVDSADQKAPRHIANRLMINLQRMNQHSKKPYQLSFSLGSSYFNGDSDESIYHLLAEADKAMYQNKNEK